MARAKQRSKVLCLSLNDFTPILKSTKSIEKKLSLFEILIPLIRRRRSTHTAYKGLDELLDEAVHLVRSVRRHKGIRLFRSLAGLPEAWETAKFVEYATEVGLRSNIRTAPPNLVISAFNSNPSRRGLLSFLDSRMAGTKDAQRLDDSAYRVDPGDRPAVRYAVARLRLTAGHWGADDIESIVPDLSAVSDAWLLDAAAMQNIEKNTGYVALLRAACSTPRVRQSFMNNPLRLLSTDLDARPSLLSFADERRKLELPDLP
jgi:hypothetical protein